MVSHSQSQPRWRRSRRPVRIAARTALAATLLLALVGCVASEDQAQDRLVAAILADVPDEIADVATECVEEAISEMTIEEVNDALGLNNEPVPTAGAEQTSIEADNADRLNAGMQYAGAVTECVNAQALTDALTDKLIDERDAGFVADALECSTRAIDGDEIDYSEIAECAGEKVSDEIADSLSGDDKESPRGTGINSLTMLPIALASVGDADVCAIWDDQGAQNALVPAVPVPCAGPKVIVVAGFRITFGGLALKRSNEEWSDVCRPLVEEKLGAPLDTTDQWTTFSVYPVPAATLSGLFQPSVLTCGITAAGNDPTWVWSGEFNPQK